MPENNRIFITGGVDENVSRNCELVFDKFKRRYNKVFKMGMPSWRNFHSMCYLDSKKFVVTGSREKHKNSDRNVEEYDLQTNNWKKLSCMNSGRSRHSSMGFQGKFVYVFCGLVE